MRPLSMAMKDGSTPVTGVAMVLTCHGSAGNSVSAEAAAAMTKTSTSAHATISDDASIFFFTAHPQAAAGRCFLILAPLSRLEVGRVNS